MQIAHTQQECIPVGCVPAARRPYAGVCFPGGWCLVRGVGGGAGVWSGGVVVSALGEWCLVRGGGVWSGGGGGGIPACTEADPLPSCEQNE